MVLPAFMTWRKRALSSSIGVLKADAAYAPDVAPSNAAASRRPKTVLRQESDLSMKNLDHLAATRGSYIPRFPRALTAIIAVTQASMENPAIPSSAMPGPTQRAIRCKPSVELMISLPRRNFLPSLWQIA
jgi:hypothetical protein